MNWLVLVIAYLLGGVTVISLGINAVNSFFDGIRDLLSGLGPPWFPF